MGVVHGLGVSVDRWKPELIPRLGLPRDFTSPLVLWFKEFQCVHLYPANTAASPSLTPLESLPGPA